MDCYEWRNCEGDCENCEVANIDIAHAVQTWTDADFMTHNYFPEEVLGLLRQLGERAERAERERDELREALREIIQSVPGPTCESIARRALEESNAT